MKPHQLIYRITAALLVSGILFTTACKKEASTASEDPLLVSEAITDEIQLNETFEDVFDNAAGIDLATAGDEIGIYGGTGFGLFPGLATPGQPSVRCFTVSVTPRERGVFPKKVVLDFGTGCEINGITRKGKIITVYSGPLHVPGSKAVTEFDGYQINDLKIAGRYVVQNTTEPGSNQRRFTRTVESKVTQVSTGNWRTWSGVSVMKQIEGNGTPLWPVDDVYQFTGSRKGENSKGRKWASETKEPLIKAFICRWISKGILLVRVNDTVATLDFGNGTCNDEATITVNGVSKVIKLR
jgi:hypothetical protein